MRSLIIIVLAVLQLAAAAPPRPEVAEKVSLIRLIANPDAYDGKRVRVYGFVNLEFEGDSIYLNKDAFDAGLYDAVWIVRPKWVDANAARRLSYRYGVVQGTFNARSHGHLGLFEGSIEQVEEIQPLPPRSSFGYDYQSEYLASRWSLYLTSVLAVLAFTALSAWLARRCLR